jgi:hypothetical protein
MIQRLGSLLALDKETADGDDRVELTEIMRLAREQVEYYMSMVNLDRDSFFREKVEKSGDGTVSIDLFLNCNRIKQMQITKEDLLTACGTSRFLIVNAEKQSIGPMTKYHKDVRRQQKMVRIEGFDPGEDIDVVYAVVSENLGEPENLLMQYKQNEAGERSFTGAVHVLFGSEEAAAEAGKHEICFGEKRLIIEKFSEYEERIRRDRKQTK